MGNFLIKHLVTLKERLKEVEVVTFQNGTFERFERSSVRLLPSRYAEPAIYFNFISRQTAPAAASLFFVRLCNLIINTKKDFALHIQAGINSHNLI